MRRMVASIVVVLLVAGCSGDDGTPRLTFYGDRCEYRGPTTLEAGLIEFEFVNRTEDAVAAANMGRLDEGYTLEDAAAFGGPDPKRTSAPSWSTDVQGVWDPIGPGKTNRWKGTLGPGLYVVVCARVTTSSYLIWFGGGFTIEEAGE